MSMTGDSLPGTQTIDDPSRVTGSEQSKRKNVRAADVHVARRSFKRLAGAEPEAPMPLSPATRRRRSVAQPRCTEAAQFVPNSDIAIPRTEEPGQMTAAPAQDDFWDDPLFQTPLTRLDDLPEDTGPSSLGVRSQ